MQQFLMIDVIFCPKTKENFPRFDSVKTSRNVRFYCFFFITVTTFFTIGGPGANGGGVNGVGCVLR